MHFNDLPVDLLKGGRVILTVKNGLRIFFSFIFSLESVIFFFLKRENLHGNETRNSDEYLSNFTTTTVTCCLLDGGPSFNYAISSTSLRAVGPFFLEVKKKLHVEIFLIDQSEQ